MRPYTLKIPAGSSEEIACDGNYVRLADATVAITIEATDNNEKVTLLEGDDAKLHSFVRLRFSHEEASEQTIVVYVGKDTQISSARIGGALIVSPTQSGGTYSHGAVTVTNASAQIAAANSNRRYLRIQNRDAAGVVFLNINGVAATVGRGGNGIMLEPGEVFEMSGMWVCTAAIFAIGDIASNPNVHLIEGN